MAHSRTVIKDELSDLNSRLIEQCKLNKTCSRVFHMSFSSDFRLSEPSRYHRLTLVVQTSGDRAPVIEMLWENSYYGSTRVQFTRDCLTLECALSSSSTNNWQHGTGWEREFREIVRFMIGYIRAQQPNKESTTSIISLDHIPDSSLIFRYF